MKNLPLNTHWYVKWYTSLSATPLTTLCQVACSCACVRACGGVCVRRILSFVCVGLRKVPVAVQKLNDLFGSLSVCAVVFENQPAKAWCDYRCVRVCVCAIAGARAVRYMLHHLPQ